MSFTQGSVVEDLTSATRHRLNESKVCVIDFWAPWCVPCRKLSPSYEAACAHMSKEAPGQIGFFRVNVETEPELAVSYGIMSIPAVVALEGESAKGRFSGRPTADDLIKWMRKLI